MACLALRRAAWLAVAGVLLALPAAAPAASRSQGWARDQVAFLLRQGVFPRLTTPADFRPQEPLTVGTLQKLLAVVPEAEPVALPTDPAQPVTVRMLDAAFVEALGLRDVAADVARGLRRAGLSPPAGSAIEVVARALGLRYDHPQAQDALELRPDDVATRAEGAYTAWKVATQSPGTRDYVRDQLSDLSLPPVPAAAQGPLATALEQIGEPYVWAGASPEDGGFDCSGLVTYAESEATWLGGRSSFAVAAAAAPADRIPEDQVQAGDVVLFGPRGPATPASQIDHLGLALGGVWFVHSSSEGVSLERLDADWYASRFAFARRPPVAAP
jgi:cell wall-associated NlpC family hydrolase